MIEERYEVDTVGGPSLWLTEESRNPPPPPPSPEFPSPEFPSPFAIYWIVFGYVATGGILAWIGEALHGDLPTLCALWLILGAWLWVLAAIRGADQ